jgi:hypothetical protein
MVVISWLVPSGAITLSKKMFGPYFLAQIVSDVKTRRYSLFLVLDLPGVSRYNSTNHARAPDSQLVRPDATADIPGSDEE